MCYGIPVEHLKIGGVSVTEIEEEFVVGHYVLFVVPEADGKGFAATAIHFATCGEGADINRWWECPDATADPVFDLYAQFDGARHMYWADSEGGYLHYPDLEDLIALLKRVRELELKHCWDAPKKTA